MSAYKDYMFLLRPSALVNQQIKFFKEKAAAHIGVFPSLKSSAHISITEYTRQKPFMMEPALDMATKRIERMAPVQLQINGFNFFPHGEERMTIYAVIQPTYQTDKWFDTLSKQLQLKKKITPHITIARSIGIDAFYQLWPHFRPIAYKERFEVTQLTILERETFAPNKKWEIYREIPFKKDPAMNIREEAWSDY